MSAVRRCAKRSRCLRDEQLVQIYRQVGTIVAPVRISLIEEGRFVRSTLECANHVELALSITRRTVRRVRRIVERQRRPSPAATSTSSSELDEPMHRRLFEFAGRGARLDDARADQAPVRPRALAACSVASPTTRGRAQQEHEADPRRRWPRATSPASARASAAHINHDHRASAGAARAARRRAISPTERPNRTSLTLKIERVLYHRHLPGPQLRHPQDRTPTKACTASATRRSTAASWRSRPISTITSFRA